MVDGIPHICHFFTQAKFLENKIYTKKRINYDKLHSKLPILRINYDKLHSKLPIFCVTSEKIYTGQKKFTRALPVAPVTNMRYVLIILLLLILCLETEFEHQRTGSEYITFSNWKSNFQTGELRLILALNYLIMVNTWLNSFRLFILKLIPALKILIKTLKIGTMLCLFLWHPIAIEI